MSAGQINVPIVFRGPNGAAAGVGAQHSQVCDREWLLASYLITQRILKISPAI
jgi:pyruvate dehydrogenase E1 component beta subunit